MTRFEAFLFLRSAVRDKARVRQALGLEAAMECLAEELRQDVELWSLTGLLADVDADLVLSNPKARGQTAADMLRAEGLPAELLSAVAGRLRPGPYALLLTRALAACEPAVAVALELVLEAEDVDGVTPAQLVAALDDASVAPSASRSRIHALEDDGVELDNLFRLVLLGLGRAAADLFSR